ncbi:MAG: ATP-binding protein [Candidatus Woesebacteria bacterium]|jgi:signal transduction histidine kinase
MLLLFVTILALSAQILLALVVLLKDSSSLRNRAFGLLSMALLIWAALNYYDAIPGMPHDIYVIRSIMFFAVLQNIFFVLFSFSLKNKPLKFGLRFWAYGLISIIAGTMCYTPFMFSEVGVGGYPVAQPGMLAFLIHAIVSVAAGFKSVVGEYKKSVGVYRRQLLYILLASVVLWGIVPLTNFVLSMTLRTAVFSAVSPLYSFVFSTLIAYAIIRHRLFDIRLAIARALTYLLLFATLVLGYALMVFGIIQLFFADQSGITPEQNAIYIAAALFLAVTYEPLKRFFRRWTNKVFFQDAYDTKYVIDQVTSVLVRASGLSDISRQSLEVLTAYLKVECAAVIIPDGDEFPQGRIVIVGHKKVDYNDILQKLPKRLASVTLIDDFSNPESQTYKLMRLYNIAACVRLESSKEQIGYMMLGFKQNGHAYTNQDVELIRIVADELAVAVQNTLRFEKIAAFNQTLQQEIEDSTKQLRANNKKLQELDEAKDEFISMASHQLRTPLTSVKGYLSMALEGDAGELKPGQKKLIEEAYSSAQRMVYMISDFLNISRIKTGKFVLERETVRLPQLIKEELPQIESTAKSRGITVNVFLPEHFPALRLDENKIRQVIMNFMDNATFYSNSGGNIDIELTQDGKDVMFTVKDDGIGVPDKEQAKIFTKFFRASNARHMRPDGTGLGLFMAKKVITAHDGELVFKTAENKGSTFGFRLPIGPNKAR